MGSLSIWHWIIVIAVVLLLFGRGKISELMGDVAQGIKAFKKGMSEDEVAKTEPGKPDVKVIDNDNASTAPASSSATMPPSDPTAPAPQTPSTAPIDPVALGTAPVAPAPGVDVSVPMPELPPPPETKDFIDTATAPATSAPAAPPAPKPEGDKAA